MKVSAVILLTAGLLFVSFGTIAKEQSKASDVFNQMKSLEGDWHKENTSQSKFSISFELTANDTVLVETWLYNNKKHSLTVYHMNNDKLMATHYCPQGNQPRLQLTKNSTPHHLSFTFLDATNLASLDNSHQHSLGFEFSDKKNKVLRKESYLSDSEEDLSELVLVRSIDINKSL